MQKLLPTILHLHLPLSGFDLCLASFSWFRLFLWWLSPNSTILLATCTCVCNWARDYVFWYWLQTIISISMPITSLFLHNMAISDIISIRFGWNYKIMLMLDSLTFRLRNWCYQMFMFVLTTNLVHHNEYRVPTIGWLI